MPTEVPIVSAPATLEDANYLRQRLTPSLDDSLYLHLSDLKLALDSALPHPAGRVLDYGCGGSPYRSLVNATCYHRADLPGIPGVDFPFGVDSKLSAADADYDCVLSTQVLEHVKNLDSYLHECRRVLRPTGRLVLTTHGTFNDHGCPYDFRRWTADGLCAELEHAGFQVARIAKLTTNPRALLYLNQQFHDRLLVRERTVAAWMLRLSRLVYTRLRRRRLNELADREYAHCRVVPTDVPGHELYIALLAIGTRPDEPPPRA